jgi:hypothetical protein
VDARNPVAFIASERALLLVREGVGFWGGEEQHPG